MKPRSKAKQTFFVAVLCICLSACSLHEEPTRKSKVEEKCQISARINLCANWDLDELECADPRFNYLTYKQSTHTNDSADTYKKEVELLTTLHTCLKNKYLQLPVFQTAKKLLVQKEIIQAQEVCNAVKSKLRKFSRRKMQVGSGLMKKETNRCFI